jgi:hypothetical protein
MTASMIREMLHATPFRPFQVLTSDGNQWPVDHPDFLSISPASDVVVIYKPKGGFTVIDPAKVNSLDIQPARS